MIWIALIVVFDLVSAVAIAVFAYRLGKASR